MGCPSRPAASVVSNGGDQWLLTGGSQWKVGERHGHPGLEPRVPPEVQHLAEAAMTGVGESAALLADAWAAAFGVEPDPEIAYVKTVKAVEAAAVPLIQPDFARATLGTVIKRLAERREWTLGFRHEDDKHDSGEVVEAMMRAIWVGRGGQGDYAATSQSDAETAVLLAVLLIYLLQTGRVKFRSR